MATNNIKCAFCKVNPSNHSFKEINNYSQNNSNARVFYSRPADAKLYKDTKSVIHHFECELLGIGDWEWIFDCEEMDIGHYTQFGLVRELCQLFALQGGLRRVKIINSGWLINLTVRCARLVWPKLPEIQIT